MMRAQLFLAAAARAGNGETAYFPRERYGFPQGFPAQSFPAILAEKQG